MWCLSISIFKAGHVFGIQGNNGLYTSRFIISFSYILAPLYKQICLTSAPKHPRIELLLSDNSVLPLNIGLINNF